MSTRFMSNGLSRANLGATLLLIFLILVTGLTTSGTTTSSGGTAVHDPAPANWGGPNAVLVQDGMYALPNNISAEWLYAYGFSFDVPDNATITGLEVKVVAMRCLPADCDANSNSIRIALCETPSGAYGRASRTVVPSIDTWSSQIAGSSSDVWGADWTPQKVNSPQFSIALLVNTCIFAGAYYARIDYVEVTVHYTEPDTTAPLITCPADITIEAGDSEDPSNTGQATAADAGDPDPTITYADARDGSCPEIITRTWTAEDECGNCSSCNQTITVEDTTAPSISSVSVSDTLISDADIGTAFAVTIDFSEVMKEDGSSDPLLVFVPDVSSTLAFQGGSWIDSDTYRAMFDVSDADVESESIIIDVTGAKDASGNDQEDYTPQSELSIDTKNPQATVTTTQTTIGGGSPIYENDLVMTVIISYDEDMDTSTRPTVTLENEVAARWTGPTDGNWGGSTDTYTATFTHDGAEEEILGTVHARVADQSGATDLVGNADLGDDSGVLDIDTCRPIATSILRHAPADEITNADQVTFLVVFDEVVLNVDPRDFVAAGPASASVLVQGAATTYEVRISGGDMANRDAPVDLSFSDELDIVDTAGNLLSSLPPMIWENYILDNTAPVFSAVLVSNWSVTTNEYIKDGDDYSIEVWVTDANLVAYEDDDHIVPDLAALGFSGYVAPFIYFGNYGEMPPGFMPASCNPSDGVLTVTVHATDRAGNTGSESDTIIADNSAPISMVSCGPNNPSNVTNPSFTFNATDAVSGVAQVECHLTGSATQNWTVCATSGDPMTEMLALLFDGRSLPTDGSADGLITFEVRASDVVGNLGAAATWTWAYDSQPPAKPEAPDLNAASDSGQSNLDNVTNVTSPTFDGPGGSVEGGSTIEVTSSQDGILGATIANADGSWSFAFGGTLSDGTHEITITAKDAAYNSSDPSDPLAVLVDTAIPVITCPADITIEAGDSEDPANTGQATAVDARDPDPNITYADACDGSCPEIITRTWTAEDDCGNSSSCDQTIIVQGSVLAFDDTAQTREGKPVKIDVLANDIDTCIGNADTLEITAITPPSNGRAQILGSNEIRYAPSRGFIGTDQFTYTIRNELGSGPESTAEVTVKVIAKIAASDAYLTACSGVSQTIWVTATDPWISEDGFDLSISIIHGPMHGIMFRKLEEPEIFAPDTISIEFVYASIEGFTGRDSIRVNFQDPFGYSTTAVVDIYVEDCTTGAYEAPVIKLESGALLTIVTPKSYSSVISRGLGVGILVSLEDGIDYSASLSASLDEERNCYVITLDSGPLPIGKYILTMPLENGAMVEIAIGIEAGEEK